MTVTVLVPSYRRPDALRTCLEGLFAGSVLPTEIVVVLRDVDEESQRQFAEWTERGDFVDPSVAVRHVIAVRGGRSWP